MIGKRELLCAPVVMLSLIATAWCAMEPETVKDRRPNMVVGGNKDASLLGENITTVGGATVGFRFEVINPSSDTNLVLVVRDSICFLFDVRLKDANGVDISPMLPELAKDKRAGDPKGYRYVTVAPQTSCTWFLPVPKQIRTDAAKPSNEGNLQPTPDGMYSVDVVAAIGYFVQKATDTKVPDGPEFQTLKLVLHYPRVTVARASFDLDIFKVYTEGIAKQ